MPLFPRHGHRAGGAARDAARQPARRLRPPRAPETCSCSIPRQSPGRGKTPPTRRSRPSLTAPHRRAHRNAFAPAARPAISSTCASSTPGRCVGHEPARRLSAIAPGRAGHATSLYRLLVASSGSPSADVPSGSLTHAPKSPCPTSFLPHRPANGLPPAAHHQHRRRPGKSIAANAAPPRSVQPSFCGGFAPQKLLLRLRVRGSYGR